MSEFIENVKRYLAEHTEIKMVSFDIFNTILLRYAEQPEDVYTEAGKRLQLPLGITAEDYKYIRVQTQRTVQSAKKKRTGSAEVSLEDITAELPKWIDAKKAAEAEMDAEKELDFGNPEMLSFMIWLEKKGYEIIYASDMYLSAERIHVILREAGIPLHKTFVSCEFDVDKKSGQLFEKVIRSLDKRGTQIVHIGDNLDADILGAEKCGIKAFLYKAPYADASSGLAMEKFVLGGGWADKNILRHVAGAFAETDDAELKKWSALGAQMVGPLIAYYMEWISTQIMLKKDDMILFFMREGAFFQKAWNIYSRYQGINKENKLVFVSRRALLLPMMEQFGERELEEILDPPQITIAEIFHILGICEWEERFDSYLKVRRKDFEKIDMEGRTLYQEIKEFLLSEKMKSHIEAKIKEEKETARQYFRSLNIQGRVATVDIGYRGTIQKRLEKVMAGEGDIQWDHFLLLCNGARRLDEPERDNISGALGTYCGEGSSLMSVVDRNNRSLELLFLEGCGSTIGYAREKEEKVMPILEPLQWSEKQKDRIDHCQQGALDYLRLYLESGKRREWSREELLQMLYRLLSSPSYSEAEMLGSLEFDENNGTEYIRRICEEKDIGKIREAGIEAWQKDADYKEVQWIEGLMTLGAPEYILQRGRDNRGYNESYALNLVKKLLEMKTEQVYIVAAGMVGRLVAKYAEMVHVSVRAFVDNNPGLQGRTIHNIPVISFENCDKGGTYVIASIPYREELRGQLAGYVSEAAVVIN